MTKYYTTKNSHAAMNEAEKFNSVLADTISKAWEVCEDIDKYCEWDEQTIGTIVDALNQFGETELAENLTAECVMYYGNADAEVIENNDMYADDWGDDW